VGVFEWLFGERELAATSLPEPAPVVKSQFAVDGTSIPAEIFGFSTTSNPIAPVGKITRDSARQIPAVKRARDIIAGTLGGIPLQVIDRDNEVTSNALLDQPEYDVPRSVTLARLFEDLLYDGVAYWKRVENNYKGYPVKVQRIDPSRVSVQGDKLFIDGRQVSYDTIIRFDSPNGPLLYDGARAIRTLLRLEATAANYADDPMPQGYFSPVDASDPADDDDIRKLLAAWKVARQNGSTGYVPAALEYKALQFTPDQLQMSEARQHAVLEIARLTGIDAEDLSVSTTSRTYFNGQDRRQQRISDVLGPYSLAVTDRLRMRDITPQGYEVRADFSAFLRADDKTRLENYQLAKALGLLSLEDIAKREGLPTPDEPEAEPVQPPLTAVQLPQNPKEIAS
jgi:phage portal protein BeeE